jgi:hypothetical protein
MVLEASCLKVVHSTTRPTTQSSPDVVMVLEGGGWASLPTVSRVWRSGGPENMDGIVRAGELEGGGIREGEH